MSRWRRKGRKRGIIDNSRPRLLLLQVLQLALLAANHLQQTVLHVVNIANRRDYRGGTYDLRLLLLFQLLV